MKRCPICTKPLRYDTTDPSPTELTCTNIGCAMFLKKKAAMEQVRGILTDTTRAAYVCALEAVCAAPSQQHAIAAIRRLIEGEIMSLELPDEIKARMDGAG